MIRKPRKTHKLRGSKSYGWGYKKKRRGSGHKGGKGGAGYHKHKWLRTIKLGLHLPKKGFHKQPSPPEIKTINISTLDQIIDSLIEKKIAAKEGEKISIDLSKIGIDKLLGTGKIMKPIFVKAKYFSENAKSKLEKAGGGILARDN